MSEIERLAAELREANAELEVQSPDLTQTVDHAHRSLIRRLLLASALSAIGATLLLAGGITPAAVKRAQDRQEKTASKPRHDSGGGNKHHGNDGGNGHHHDESNGTGDGKHKRDEHHEMSVGPGAPIAVELPDLVITRLTKTEVTVENLSPTSTEPFEILVKVEVEGREASAIPVLFEQGLAGEGITVKEFNPECESGTISAEADPANEIEESLDDNNASTETVECKPVESKEEEVKDKEATGTVDSATTAADGASEP